MKAARFRLGVFVALVLVAVVAGSAQQAGAVSTSIDISQVYGGGGNSGAPYQNDYVELFNRSGALLDLTGWSLQYTSATGTGNFGSATNLITPLSGVLSPGQYLLVQEAGGTTGAPLPPPFLTDSTPINMSATGGKVALVNTTTPLGCNGGSTACSPTALATIVDLIGYDGANFFEGAAPAPTLSNTSAALRANGGCTDTDNNAADFTAGAPAPRNRLSPGNSCGDSAPSVASTTPSNGATSVPVGTNLTINFSEPVDVTGSWVEIFCGTSHAHAATTTGGPTSFVVDPTDDFAPGESCAVTVQSEQVTDQDANDPPDNMVSDYNFSFMTAEVTPPDAAPAVASTTPANGAADVALSSNISVNFSEPVNVTGSWYSISCAGSGAHPATASPGPQSFTIDPATDFSAGEQCTVNIVAANVTDQDTSDPPDNMAADYSWSFTTVAPPVAIHDIQGASHTSPKNGQSVAGVPGIVTAKRTNGFYMQDPSPDSDPATSEGIFVFTSSAPTSVNVGDAVRVNGTVTEFRPGGASTANLTTTEIGTPSISVISSGNPLPTATILGTGGRIPPDSIIEDDATPTVEGNGTFDPASDGIDFYESVEAMRVQLNDAVAVGPTNSFGETPVIADNGDHASVRTPRGGILLRASDGNPERIIADDVIAPLPSLNVGDGYAGPLEGVVDYNFGNFFLEVTTSVGRIDRHLQQETTTAPGTGELAVATFNFENLDTGDPQAKVDALAHEVVNNLLSPDLIAGEEVQDNNGATNNGNVDANGTLDMLVARIEAAGGPHYDYRYINPVNNQDGGEPGGNIRQVFLFRTDRGLAFVDHAGGTSTTSTGVSGSGGATQLTFSPGRIDPTNSAFNSSRKPLAGEFSYRGQKLFVIANHFNSKGGDDPLMGRFQPPIRNSEVQRHQQAQIVANFVSQVTGADSSANVIVLGDLNDFEFSETVSILEGAGLHDLMETLPENERYSYEFEGNAQVLDHIMVGQALASRPLVFDPVHVNAEFADQASDHDPSVVRLKFNEPPTAGAGGPYSVDEGSTVSVTASGTDPENGPLAYAWDLDDNGSFETPGQTAMFSAASLDGPATRTIHVRVTDDGGLTAVADATVTIRNVPPTATFTAPATTPAGFPFTLSLSSPHDPSSADTAAGFQYAFDCGNGSGYGAFGNAASTTCSTSDTGTRSVGGKIRDKDGGVREYRGSVQVIVTFSSLCDLVRSYSTDPKVAEDLCDKLRQAQGAPNDNARAGMLGAFRNQVDAKTGKGLTAAQAALLKLLSTRL